MGLIYGHGIYDTNIQSKSTIYKTWFQMLRRCYSEKHKQDHPTYKDTTVDPDWHRLSSFSEWMLTQDYHGKFLDKDLLNPYCNHYSKDNCIFVGRQLNNLLTNIKSSKGNYPVGVHLNKQTGTYKAQISLAGKRKHLGLFKTVDEAKQAYDFARKQFILNLANAEQDVKLKTALLNLTK